MSLYQIVEVDGPTFADTLRQFNSMHDEFPALEERHLEDGYWWLVFCGAEAVAFAGLVQFYPCKSVGYLKRCFVLPDHRGHSLQQRLLLIREGKARELGWKQLVSECSVSNTHSAYNFRRAGYQICEPEQPWAKDSVFFVKDL